MEATSTAHKPDEVCCLPTCNITAQTHMCKQDHMLDVNSKQSLQGGIAHQISKHVTHAGAYLPMCSSLSMTPDVIDAGPSSYSSQ